MLAMSKAMLRPTLSLLVAAAVMIASRPMIARADDTAPEPGGPAPTQPTSASGAAPVSSAEPAPEQPSPPPIEDPTPQPIPSEGATTTKPAASEPVPAKPAATKPVPEPAAARPDPDDDILKLPQRLPPMQTAGWWTLFAGFTIGTVAGVLAGLAEREEDAAVRLAARYDLDSGSQPLYDDVRDEYEDTLRRGKAEADAAIALAVVGLGAAVAGITVLAVAHVRERRAKRGLKPQSARHIRVHGGGLQVRF